MAASSLISRFSRSASLLRRSSPQIRRFCTDPNPKISISPNLAAKGGGDWDYSKACTVVWWDMKTTPTQKWNDDLLPIKEFISHLLASLGYRSDFKLHAYFDSLNGKKHDSILEIADHIYCSVDAQEMLLLDMVTHSPEIEYLPRNYMLISANKIFYRALRKLRGRRYNILVARPAEASHVFDNVATTVWNWEDIVDGAYGICPNGKQSFPSLDTCAVSDFGYEKGNKE